MPLARLSTVFPPGGRQGTTVEVVVTGTDLDLVKQLYFSNTGISATPKMAPGTSAAEPNKFAVAIGADVPPGVYDARVVGRFGISNPRAFVVGDRPELTETATNHTVATAMTVPLETVLNGHANPDAVDYFQFSAKKGQRLLIECAAYELDSRMDPVLLLEDGSGRELERNRHGGLLDFTMTADGQYRLLVHDQLYRGGDEYAYRLGIGTGADIEFALPSSGQPGSAGEYVLYGRNLPGGTPVKDLSFDGNPLERLAVEIRLPSDRRSAARLPAGWLPLPAAAVLDGIEYRLHAAGGISNPALIGFATAPVVVEQPTEGTPEQGQKVSVPCEFVGRFHPRGQPTWITFDAGQGDVYWVEIFSERLGWVVDPFVLVQRLSPGAKGEMKVSDVQEVYASDANIGGPQFNTATRDPAWRFEVKETGAYRVQVRDLFNENEPNPGAVYRLSIRKESPDFRLVVLPQAPPLANKDAKEARVWTAFLRRGETTPIQVLALRRDGFDGEVQLTVEGLPPGVNASEARIAGKENTASILLTAAESAPGWFGPIKIAGRAKVGETSLVREARGGTVVWNVTDYSAEAVHSRLTSDFALAVSSDEAAPLSIDAAENKLWETSVAGKFQIPIKLVRRGELKGNLKLRAAGLPALDSAKEIEIDGKATNAVLELDLTQQKIPVGLHVFHLQTQAEVKYSRLTPDDSKAAGAEAKAVEEQARRIEKSVAEMKSAATKAADQLAAAKKSSDGAAAEPRPFEEKLVAARVACEKSPSDPLLLAAKMAAEKEAAEADARSKAAADFKAAAEKVSSALSAKLRDAEKEMESAMNRAKASAQKIQPQDVAVTVYSPSIRLKVTAAPITLSAEAPVSPLAPGSKLDLPVTIERLYQFTDPVELDLVAPKGLAGLSAPKVTIPKGQNHVTLVIVAAPKATPGNHTLTLRAALKLNNQDLQIEQAIGLRIASTDDAQKK
ncbi:MAG: COG1470 family protein [Limisphaerales bacterium]